MENNRNKNGTTDLQFSYELDSFVDRMLGETVHLPEEGTQRARILEAARKLIAEKGVDGTSMRNIAEMAGVNQAMIHYYFRSKENLYSQVVKTQFLLIIKATISKVDRDWTPGTFITHFPILLIEVLRNEPSWSRIIMREIVAGSQQLSQFIHELGISGPNGLHKLLDKQIEAGIQTKEIHEYPISALIHFLFSLSFGAVFVAPILQNVNRIDSKTWETSYMEVFQDILANGLCIKKGA